MAVEPAGLAGRLSNDAMVELDEKLQRVIGGMCGDQPAGVVDVHTVRQATQNADGSIDPGGKLVGIEEYSQEEFDSRFLMSPATAEETATFGFVGNTGGVTFEERFAKYKDFGITYVEAQNASGQGNVYLNGQLVSRFSDISPDGSAFSFTSADKGGIAVQTVYDRYGRLTGVETVRE